MPDTDYGGRIGTAQLIREGERILEMARGLLFTILLEFMTCFHVPDHVMVLIQGA